MLVILSANLMAVAHDRLMHLDAVVARWINLGETHTPRGRALLREQFRMLQRQMPTLCAVLCLSILSGICGYGIPETTPWLLRVALPVLLLALTLIRLRYWLSLRRLTPTPEDARRQLAGVRVRAVLLVTAYSMWGLGVFEQADLGH